MDAQTRKNVALRALPLVDLTDLTDTCNHAAIDTLCKRAQTSHGNVGAICIWPRFVAHAHAQLKGTGIPIATVVNFPSGDGVIEQVAVEAEAALRDGADELDLVLPYRAFLNGDEHQADRMVRTISGLVNGVGLLKVIIETGELGSDDAIHRASELAIDAGADFIKTSTGKVPVNATPEAAKVMLDVIAGYNKSTIGFKAAGGVKTTEDASTYLDLADQIMGPDWAGHRTFRFGASGVLDDLLAAIDGGSAQAKEGY